MDKLVAFNWGDVRAIFEIQFSLWSDSFKKIQLRAAQLKMKQYPFSLC